MSEKMPMELLVTPDHDGAPWEYYGVPNEDKHKFSTNQVLYHHDDKLRALDAENNGLKIACKVYKTNLEVMEAEALRLRSALGQADVHQVMLLRLPSKPCTNKQKGRLSDA